MTKYPVRMVFNGCLESPDRSSAYLSEVAKDVNAVYTNAVAAFIGVCFAKLDESKKFDRVTFSIRRKDLFADVSVPFVRVHVAWGDYHLNMEVPCEWVEECADVRAYAEVVAERMIGAKVADGYTIGAPVMKSPDQRAAGVSDECATLPCEEQKR